MKHQSGNALWFILIAIGLLGLLTITFSRNSENNDSGDYEQNQIAATEVMRYAKSIENAVQSLLARGCSENEISFENNVVTGYTNANAPADNSCHVFRSSGAGMTYKEPNQQWLDSIQSAKGSYGEIIFSSANGITNIGNDSSRDLTFILPFITQDLCLTLNNNVGVTNPSDDAPNDSDVTMGIKFQGSYNGSVSGSTRIEGEINGSELSGKYSGCYLETTGCSGIACYGFYHVLHTR